MVKYLIKHKVIINMLMTLVQASVLGLYINLLTNAIGVEKNFYTSLKLLGNWNFLFVLILLLVFCQIKLEALENRNIKMIKTKIINQILEAACKALIFPSNKKHIRAIITVCNFRTKKRETKYAYNVLTDPERTAIYDIEFGVTGEAFKKRIPIARELPINHISTYNTEEQGLVAPQLRSILAAPIFSPDDKRKVIAVLAFDSFETIKSIKFESIDSMVIAQSWADVLSEIISI